MAHISFGNGTVPIFRKSGMGMSLEMVLFTTTAKLILPLRNVALGSVGLNQASVSCLGRGALAQQQGKYNE